MRLTPREQKILDLLKKNIGKELTVQTIADKLRIKKSTASNAIRVLEIAKLVQSRKQGKNKFVKSNNNQKIPPKSATENLHMKPNQQEQEQMKEIIVELVAFFNLKRNSFDNEELIKINKFLGSSAEKATLMMGLKGEIQDRIKIWRGIK